MPDITVVIPTIPPRAAYLQRAKRSVLDQTLPPTRLIVQLDNDRAGAAITRQAGLEQVDTEWVAFLDDDDEFLPIHLEQLYTAALCTAADYVYSWYEVIGGQDPRAESFGVPFDPCNPIQTTITTLVRTDLAQSTGFLNPSDTDLTSPDRLYAGEDWLFTSRCVTAGADIVHHPAKTWLWYHHGANTSGLPRW